MACRVAVTASAPVPSLHMRCRAARNRELSKRGAIVDKSCITAAALGTRPGKSWGQFRDCDCEINILSVIASFNKNRGEDSCAVSPLWWSVLAPLQSSAYAAEVAMPIKAKIVSTPPLAPAAGSPVSLYAGAHIGGGWSRFSSPVAIGTLSPSGALGGLQLGANLQSGNFVYGIEGDVSIAGVHGRGTGVIGGVAATSTVTHHWFATLAGRAGYALGRTLIYAKGGVAWTQFRWEFATAAASLSQNRDRFGWMLGVGVEQAFTDTVSVKLEYNYMDFGRRTETITPAALVVAPTDVRLYAHVAKLGVNYRFMAGR